MKSKLAVIIIAVNCVVAFIVGAFVYSMVSLGELVRSGRASHTAGSDTGRPDAKSTGIDFEKKTLMDRDKTMKSIDSMKENYFKIKNDNPLIYTALPESEFFNSLLSYFFISHVLSAHRVTLDDAMVEEFRKQGTLVYSMDRDYPFMKQSIYIDKNHRTADKPVLSPGTNVIIIFIESLSAFFLNEEAHGVRGLMPNIRAMGRESYSFESMNNASFPTIKGLIAALGSAIYLLDENIGGTRIPIPCRFLFLSNVFKSMNYSTTHIQAGSERFIGMRDFFMKREGYDNFYGSESLALDNVGSFFSRGFGVDDDTLFNFVVNWLKKYNSNKPFLLTVHTINSHPPFKVKYAHPDSGGNEMINALYSTDKAFGKFWDYFKKSKYAGNTMIILSADHAMGNNKQYIKFVKRHEKYYHPFFDRIPCFMHFPSGAWAGTKNNTSCLNLDIAPTILDMMNLDLANPFMGVSIFSERRYFPPFATAKSGSLPDFKNMDEKQMAKAKKLIGFYLNLYREDRILPKNFIVKTY